MKKTYYQWLHDIQDFTLPVKKVTEITFRSEDGRISTRVRLDEDGMRSLVSKLAEHFGIEAVVKAACGK